MAVLTHITQKPVNLSGRLTHGAKPSIASTKFLKLEITMKNQITIGAYGVNVNDDNSPVYIVQAVDGQSVSVSERYDTPKHEWIKLDQSDFWALT